MIVKRTFVLSFFVLLLSPLVYGQQLLVDTVGLKKADDIAVGNLDDKEYFLDSLGASIRPPRYFVKKGNEAVFIHPQTASSMAIDMIGEYPYVMLTENMTKEHIEKQGVELIEEFELKTEAGSPGMVYVVQFVVEGVEFYRLMYFTGDMNHTFMIVANYPKMLDKLEREAVLQSFQTIKF